MAGGSISSQVFWSLMDRWAVPDLAALDLLGRPGGLTRKGTRPRFTLAREEAHRFANLIAMDRLLTDITSNPAPWLKRRVSEAPFQGTKPLEFMLAGGAPAIDETRRYLEKLALKRSL